MPVELIQSTTVELAKRAGHICRHRGGLQVPSRDVRGEGGGRDIVWSVGWKWTYSRACNTVALFEGCNSTQSNLVRSSSHVSCEENILV